jgi:hypothetical protein
LPEFFEPVKRYDQSSPAGQTSGREKGRRDVIKRRAFLFLARRATDDDCAQILPRSRNF